MSPKTTEPCFRHPLLDIRYYYYYYYFIIIIIIIIEWCFTPLLTVFQSYHGDSSHYSCISWVSPVLGWGSEVSCPRTLPRKTQRIQCGSNPGPLDYESNTLPLSHAGPFDLRETRKVEIRHTKFHFSSKKAISKSRKVEVFDLTVDKNLSTFNLTFV